MDDNPYKAPMVKGITATHDRDLKPVLLFVGLLVGAFIGGLIAVGMMRALWNAQQIAL